MFKKVGIPFVAISFLAVLGFLAVGKNADSVDQRAIGSLTHIPTSTLTDIPTSTATLTAKPTETPTATVIPCFRLLSPENGVTLNPTGKVTFSWESMQGAVTYKLELILPSSQSVIFELNATSRDQYLEAFQIGGMFEWKVTAFDANDRILCSTESFTFEKPEFQPVQKPTKSNRDNGGGNDNGGPSGGDGGGGDGGG